MARPLSHVVRRHLGNFLIDGFFELGSAAWRALPVAQPARQGVTRVSDVPYREGGSSAHLLDVYTPADHAGAAADALLPAVLYIHGGSFRILSKESHFMMATEFAREGYIVFNMNYRLAPANPFPAAVEDVADAYRWVVENAARWGADPQRLVVAGESAGGNLTACAAIMATYARPEPYARRVFQLNVVPKAIVPLCGMLHVSDPRQPRGASPSAFIQDRIDACAEYYLGEGNIGPSPARALADPIVIIEEAASLRPFPPTFASVGTRDPLMEDTLRLGRALKKWGVVCETKTYEGEPHAFQAMTFRPLVRKQWDSVFAFLDGKV